MSTLVFIRFSLEKLSLMSYYWLSDSVFLA